MPEQICHSCDDDVVCIFECLPACKFSLASQATCIICASKCIRGWQSSDFSSPMACAIGFKGSLCASFSACHKRPVSPVQAWTHQCLDMNACCPSLLRLKHAIATFSLPRVAGRLSGLWCCNDIKYLLCKIYCELCLHPCMSYKFLHGKFHNVCRVGNVVRTHYLLTRVVFLSQQQCCNTIKMPF